jgi:hypothetical protein
MTYSIPNHYGYSFTREQSTWTNDNGTVRRLCWSSKYNEVYADLGIGKHCDIYVNDSNIAYDNLDDAIKSLVVDPEDYDNYPADDQEFIEFMTVTTTAPSTVKITSHEPQNQSEAISIASGETWSDVGIAAQWAGFDRIEPAAYRKLGTMIEKKDGSIEYEAIGHYRLNLTANSVEDAVEAIKQSFIRTQSRRHSAAWHEYLGTQAETRNRFAVDLLSIYN